MAIVGFYRWSVVISVSFLTPPAPLSKGGAREEESDRTFFPYPYSSSFQPAPVSAWVLYPQNDDTRRQTLETIIQQAIKKQPTNQIRRAS